MFTDDIFHLFSIKMFNLVIYINICSKQLSNCIIKRSHGYLGTGGKIVVVV